MTTKLAAKLAQSNDESETGDPNDVVGITAPEALSPDDAPWRSICFSPVERTVLFSMVLEFQTSSLPRWQPQVIPDPRWIEDEDE